MNPKTHAMIVDLLEAIKLASKLSTQLGFRHERVKCNQIISKVSLVIIGIMDKEI